ncbi:Rossmann-like and DUF2520 domain-containing protein [Sphingobacterium griseoflavum]|nr:Rossmann-like and DUF2520 domain-containing protein [Sphingobacterium griseoflavum]
MNITILGSGNVATHLAKAFLSVGHHIGQVYSRDLGHAQTLASLIGAQATASVTKLHADADLYLLAVTDDAIAHLVDELPHTLRGMVVHCSGATDLDYLARFPRRGVIYPPQSLQKDIYSELADIPFAVEGHPKSAEDELLAMARKFAPTSFRCNSRQRLALHIAAVFANNFTNSLFQISYELLQAEGLPFDLLHPIMQETVQKALQHEPRTIQTGPALRGDKLTIEKHLQFISKKSNWVKIYQQLTEEIRSKKLN